RDFHVTGVQTCALPISILRSGLMLILDRIGKIYPNGVNALERFSAEIRLGEIVAVIGGSGCGKSTLLRAIAGLDCGTSGTVTLEIGRASGRERGYSAGV